MSSALQRRKTLVLCRGREGMPPPFSDTKLDFAQCKSCMCCTTFCVKVVRGCLSPPLLRHKTLVFWWVSGEEGVSGTQQTCLLCHIALFVLLAATVAFFRMNIWTDYEHLYFQRFCCFSQRPRPPVSSRARQVSVNCTYCRLKTACNTD